MEFYDTFILLFLLLTSFLLSFSGKFRGGSRTAAISKMELFVIIVNGFQPLTVIKKCSILDIAAVLDPPLKFDFLMLCGDIKSNLRPNFGQSFSICH